MSFVANNRLQFYGVMFTNQKISTITPIRREDAQEFVTTEATGTG